jgi:hypothetical protein
MKMVGKNWVLVISLFAMVLLTIPPVMAYSSLVTYGPSGANFDREWDGNGGTDWFTVANYQAFKNNVTRMTFSGKAYAPFQGSKSASGVLYHDNTPVGNWTATATNSIINNVTSDFTLDVRFSDLTGALTGSHYVTYATTSDYVNSLRYQLAGNMESFRPARTTETNISVYTNDPNAIWMTDYMGWIWGGQFTIWGGAVVPPTPTPTPTPSPTVAPGYVRSTFITKSATTWNTIHGSNIMLYDTYAGTWTNSTSDADGTLYIDTLPYTTINAYATFTIFANEYADASVVANADVDGGTFIILMYPISSPPPTGSVNLFVSTMDGNNNVLRDVSVIATWSGYQHVGTSGSYGTAQWVVPNNTQVHLIATKTGYDGADEIINTGEGPSYSTILYLEQGYATPTPTITSTTVPGGTIPVTLDPRTSGEKDVAMMDLIRTSGPDLISLAIVATMMGLLGMIIGFGKR